MKVVFFILSLNLFSCNKPESLLQKEILPKLAKAMIDSLSKDYIKYIIEETNLTKKKYYDRNSIIVKVEIDNKFCNSCLLVKTSIANKIDTSSLCPNYLILYTIKSHRYAFLYFNHTKENLNYIKKKLVEDDLVDRNTEEDLKRRRYSLVEEDEGWYSCIDKKGILTTIKTPYVITDSQLKGRFCK